MGAFTPRGHEHGQARVAPATLHAGCADFRWGAVDHANPCQLPLLRALTESQALHTPHGIIAAYRHPCRPVSARPCDSLGSLAGPGAHEHGSHVRPLRRPWNSGPAAARTGPIGIGHYSTEPPKLVTKSPVFSDILGESEKLPRCYHGHFSDSRQHTRATKKPLIPVA